MALPTRRAFLENSLLASAAALAAATPRMLFADETPSDSPNEKLSVAVVGVRSRGKSHTGAFSKRPDTEITYLCDADEQIGQAEVEDIAGRQGRRPKYVRDMREVFDDKSVDIVTTATPNHWHALTSIWAMQAGKDVYVEKPVSHNVSEGRRMVEAARKYNRICQTGTQSRSNPGMREMMEYLHSGAVGEVKVGRGLCYKRRESIGPKGTYQPPKGVDYGLWCGPAPVKPLARPKLHYDWHWTWDYGNGDLGNQGIHQMDLARWGLGLDRLGDQVFSFGGRFGYDDAGETANTQVVVHDYGDKTLVFEVRGLETEALDGAKVGVIFYGTNGKIEIKRGLFTTDRGDLLQGAPEPTPEGRGEDSFHLANFFDCVRSRQLPICDVEIGHHAVIDVLMHGDDAGANGFGGGLRVEGLAGELHRACAAQIDAADDLDQGGLAGAVGAHQHRDLTRKQLERDAAKHLVLAKEFPQALHTEHGIQAHSFLPDP